ncbi:hypothetical protein [Corynebacterium heidelbergense]|uniref:Uncharacterized protein n=1 Tax=Corynebacterium heidelbergense TaxID=2055947 RepID=A0A364VDM8_9CORY|nr:hypothetical protein [Corynebacterium heidelbergense]RAV34747.1 hypothetical protein CWC39_01480 [Corynebacterium heidelbergense]WCZ37006.1 hypothetical protein CHEID_07365 [Corynebacterium heidelbergense]
MIQSRHPIPEPTPKRIIPDHAPDTTHPAVRAAIDRAISEHEEHWRDTYLQDRARRIEDSHLTVAEWAMLTLAVLSLLVIICMVGYAVAAILTHGGGQ